MKLRIILVIMLIMLSAFVYAQTSGDSGVLGTIDPNAPTLQEFVDEETGTSPVNLPPSEGTPLAPREDEKPNESEDPTLVPGTTAQEPRTVDPAGEPVAVIEEPVTSVQPSEEPEDLPELFPKDPRETAEPVAIAEPALIAEPVIEPYLPSVADIEAGEKPLTRPKAIVRPTQQVPTVVVETEPEQEQVVREEKPASVDRIAEAVAIQELAPEASITRQRFVRQQTKNDVIRKIETAKRELEVRKEARVVEDTTVVTTIVIPKAEPQVDVTIYEVIPKEVAESASELIFYGDYEVEIIEDDPLIAWHLPVVSTEVELSYGVRSADAEILDKVETVTLSERKPGFVEQWKLPLSIALIVVIIALVLVIKKLEEKVSGF